MPFLFCLPLSKRNQSDTAEEHKSGIREIVDHDTPRDLWWISPANLLN